MGLNKQHFVLHFLAVAVNAELLYAVTEVDSLGDVSTPPRTGNLGIVLESAQRKPFLIVASELVPTLQSKWGVKLSVKKTFLGSALENCRYHLELDDGFMLKHSACQNFNCYISI